MTPSFWGRRGRDKKHKAMSVEKLAAIFCMKAERAQNADEEQRRGRRQRGGRRHSNGGRAGRYE